MSEAKHLKPSTAPETVRVKNKRRRIFWLIARLLAATLITGSIVVFYFYSTRPIEIYGQKINADEKEIDLVGADIY